MTVTLVAINIAYCWLTAQSLDMERCSYRYL